MSNLEWMDRSASHGSGSVDLESTPVSVSIEGERIYVFGLGSAGASGAHTALAQRSLDLWSACLFASGSVYRSDGVALGLTCSQGLAFGISPDTGDALGEQSTRSPVAAMVAEIRSSLSIRMTELADALHVERPTVYAWIRDTSTPRPGNLERLQTVFEVARSWSQRSDLPLGGSVRQPLPGTDSSLLDELSADTIRPSEIESMLDGLAAVSESVINASEKAPRLSPGEFARQRGYGQGSTRDQETRLRSVSRGPSEVDKQ